MIPALIFKTILEVAGPVIAGQVKAKVAKNPVAVNSLNAEKPYQSRVAVGSATAAVGVVIPAAIQLLNMLGFGITGETTAYTVELVGAAFTLWGAGYALYGRFASGLKPLFTRE